jgi:hypothetical protein
MLRVGSPGYCEGDMTKKLKRNRLSGGRGARRSRTIDDACGALAGNGRYCAARWAGAQGSARPHASGCNGKKRRKAVRIPDDSSDRNQFTDDPECQSRKVGGASEERRSFSLLGAPAKKLRLCGKQEFRMKWFQGLPLHWLRDRPRIALNG